MIGERPLLVGALVGGLLALTAPVSALTLTTSGGVFTSTPGATTFYDFDSINDITVGTFSGEFQIGLFNTDPGGGGNHISTATSMTLTLANPVSYIGFLWGSPDTYNVLTVYDGATLLGSYSKADVDTGNAIFANFTAGAGETITSLVFNTSCCFETDNYANIGVSAVPIGPALPLFVTGLGVMGLLGWQRKRTTVAAATAA